MREVVLGDGVLAYARQLADKQGALKGSITEGSGNLAGYVGEIAIAGDTGAAKVQSYRYDLVSASGLTVEVKTKRRAVPPRGDYNVSVSAASYWRQRADWLAFTQTNMNASRVWILGYMPYAEFGARAEFIAKGQFEGDNGFAAPVDMLVMRIDDLYEEMELW